MPRKSTARGSESIAGEVYYTRNFHRYVSRLNGEQWQQTVNVMSEANKNHFTLNMIYREVVRKMQIPDDRALELDDSKHSFATLPPSLHENQVGWYFIEVMRPSVAASDAEPK